MTDPRSVSVIVPCRAGEGDPLGAYRSTTSALASATVSLDFVFVLEGSMASVPGTIAALRREGAPVRIVRMRNPAGEAEMFRAGFAYASGDVVVALPGNLRLDPRDLSRLVEALEGNDLAVALPRGPTAHGFRRMRTSLRSSLIRSVLGVPLSGAPVAHWAARREVVSEIPAFGRHDRFLPALAARLGFRVVAVETDPTVARELAARESRETASLADLLTAFFVTRFSRRPLRFFGFLGTPLLGAGLAGFAYLLYIKLIQGEPLANRPLLLLAVLLLVLGIQILALGLVAEIVVFTHLRDVKEYSVEEIVG